MVALWILASLIALIWLLLALPLRIFLSYENETLSYCIKYAFISLIDSEKPPKKETPKKQTTEAETQKPEKKNSDSVKKLLNFLGLSEISSAVNAKETIKAKGITGLISSVYAAVKKLFARIFKLVRKGVFKKFDLRITVGDDDAAEAALQYGQICAVTYPLMELLKNTMKFRKPHVDIRCDFEAEKSQINFSGQLNYRPWHFVCFAVGLIVNYFKNKMKKGDAS